MTAASAVAMVMVMAMALALAMPARAGASAGAWAPPASPPASSALPAPAPAGFPVSSPAPSPELPAIEANDANRARLESIRGLGPGLVTALLAARAVRPFADWDDLVARVRGIGPASARRLSAAGLRVAGQAL